MALNSNFRTLTADNIEGVVSTRNYLRNSFENGTTFGWTELNVALTNGLPTGTPTISATAATSLGLQTTNTPLSLDRSLVVQVPSALVAGDGFISDAFTIDRMDAGKVLTISFDYEMVEGTYNFSGTLGSQTWMVYVYNDTAGGANWIQPAGFLGMNQSSGPGRVTCTFQSSVVWGQKYRVAVIASQAASGMSSINFDNFTCSRQVNPIGQLRNPAGTIIATGSLTPPNGYLYCNGAVLSRTDYAELFAAIGTSYNIGGETGAQFRLPDLRGIFARGAGTNPNNANNTTTIGARQLDAFGSHDHGGTIGGGTHTHNYTVRDGGGVSQKGLYSGNASWPNPNIRNLAEFDAGGHSHTIPASGGTETRPANVGVAYHICFSSGSVQLSSDTDTRVVAARYTTSTSRTLNNTAPVLLYETLDIDSHSGYNTSTGVYTVPVSGIYRVTGNLYANAVATSSSFLTTLVLFKNNVSIANLGGTRAESSASSQKQNNGSTIAQFNAGDQITIRGYSDTPNTLVASQPQQNYFSIERLSGPSVVAASETVAMRAVKNTGAQTASGVTQTVASWTSVVQDTHGIFNATTGVATIPVSGTYLCTFQVQLAANSTGARVTQMYKNGAVGVGSMQAESNIYVSFIDRPVMVGSALLKLNAGDNLRLATYQDGAASLNYSTFDATSTNFNIVRVGN